MVIWSSSGAWTAVLAVAHIATTGAFYGESVRSTFDGGVLGAVDADPALASLRGVAFWYVTAGLVLGLLGLLVLAEERQRGAPPRGFAALMAVTGVWGVLLSPASGFWFFLPIAALAQRHRARALSRAIAERGTVWGQSVLRIETSAGPIEYVDTGGPGPVVVFSHGFPMSHTQWRKVIPLMEGCRCIAPTLPLGAHRQPMRPGADLGQIGQARLLAEFLDGLDLHDATLVMNDWGGPQFLVSEDRTERVAALVFVSCEAFDNFPPRPVRPLVALLRVPGGAALLMWLLRLGPVRHHRRAFGGLTHVGIPDAVLDEWFAPASGDRAVRRDLRRFATSAPRRAELVRRASRLADFPGRVLVLWGAEDRMMPSAHARQLGRIFPSSRVVVIDGAGTLVPEDRPEELAAELLAFLHERQPASPA